MNGQSIPQYLAPTKETVVMKEERALSFSLKGRDG
jgi:hypothetical protein